MKTKILSLLLLCLMLSLPLFAVACNGTDESPAPAGIWDSAVIKEDATLGEGAKTVTVKIEAGDKSVTLTIKTDKSTLSAAMKEHGLLDGADGLYPTVNGITADWNTDQSWWMLCKDGEMTSYGADDAPVDGGEQYSFVYTK